METLKVFITLLALINPFGAIPMFLSLTAGQSPRERRRTINTAARIVARLAIRRGRKFTGALVTLVLVADWRR